MKIKYFSSIFKYNFNYPKSLKSDFKSTYKNSFIKMMQKNIPHHYLLVVKIS